MADRARRSARRSEPPDQAAALEMAVRFLGARPRTRWEVERRLARSGTEPSVIEATVERLAGMGYVDDAEFARWWGEQRDRHAPRGRRLIEAELRRSGVPHDVIEAYRHEYVSPGRAPEDEALPGSEEERAREALEWHLRARPLPDDPKARQRIGMFLMRRGFDAETVRGALRSAGAQVEEAGDDS